MVEHKRHVVKAGECLESIAFEYGHVCVTIWNDGANAELKSKRKAPTVLKCGDELMIPPLREKAESGSTEARHRFRRKDVPCKIVLKIVRFEKPVAEAKGELVIDGVSSEVQTDSEGRIELPIMPNAREGRLTLAHKDDSLVFDLAIGGLDPEDEISGVQDRLRNLGYLQTDEGPDALGPDTREALKTFQRKHGLAETGEVDGATCDELREVHGS